MGRTPRKPKYCCHKARDRGYSRFPNPAGQPRYVTVYWPGAFDSDESYAAYVAGVNDYLRTGAVPDPSPPSAAGGITVLELTVRFWRHVEDHGAYTKAGRPTSERHALRAAFRALNELHGGRPAAGLDLDAMDALRGHMAGRGWAARTVASHLVRVRSLVRWAEGRRLVPPGTADGLRPRGGLCAAPKRAGRPTARKKPADLAAVGPVALVAGPPVCSMIYLQLLNGMRPGGACAVRPADIDRHADPRGELWLYREPADLAAKEGREEHWLGPRAQAILRPYLEAAADPAAPLFRPARRPGAARGGVTVNYYRLTVARLCARLGLPHWHPHQLRHNHGTLVRKRYGAEVARKRLGHERLETTEIYAEADAEAARRVAREIG